MAMFAIVNVSNVSPEAPDIMGADLDVIGSWGFNLSDHISQDLTGLTPAQAITGIKNKVKTWAATPGGGNITLTNAQIWLFGGPQ